MSVLLKCHGGCGQSKSLDEFHRDRSHPNRSFRATRCKPCNSIRESNRPKRYGKAKAKHVKAKNLLRSAVLSGAVVRWPCCSIPECSATEKIEAHHADYDQPLSVTWLCRKHHIQAHNETRNEQYA